MTVPGHSHALFVSVASRRLRAERPRFAPTATAVELARELAGGQPAPDATDDTDALYAAARAAVAARALADTPDAAAPTQAPALAPPVVVREADDGPLFLLAHGGS